MLERNRFAIQEHKKVLSSVQSYDIRDADTGDIIGTAIENIGFLTKTLRWVMSKQFLPTLVDVREKPDDSLVFTLRRGWYLFKSSVEVHDSQGQLVGTHSAASSSPSAAASMSTTRTAITSPT
ncbi:MAG: hypothetical protein U0792_18920 [Gemmataceae bacterium]